MEIQELCVDEDLSMIESMKRLDKSAKKILFVLRDNILLASITDGDIRRWILKKGDLQATVKDIANYEPKYLYESEKYRAGSMMREFAIDAIPIVSEKKELLSIVFSRKEQVDARKDLNLPVVIMAGGLGTRLYPYTKVLPKPLIPIGEIPIAEHIMNRFHRYGVSRFHLIVNHKKNMIKAYFNEIARGYEIDYADESRPLGTAGGLSLLKNKIRSTFILSNCDILIEEDYVNMVDFHEKEGNFITMVCSVKNFRIPYGVVEISESGEIIKFKEKPTMSFFANTGMYIAESQVIEEMKEDTKMDFPEIIKFYQEKGKKIGIYPIGEDKWLDMGQPEEMEIMRRKLEIE